MSAQPSLFDAYPEGFWRWFEGNKQIWYEFERRALRMARTGRKRYSARTIIEVLRWDTDLADTDVLFKINDHYTPGLARLWMETHGRTYPGFFAMRSISRPG